MTDRLSVRLARLLASVLVRGSGAEFVLGDLEELRAWRSRREGPAAADRRYVRDVLSLAARTVSGGRPGRRSGATTTAVVGSPGPHRRSGITRDFTIDVSVAVRELARRPGFGLVAMATLALGVGSAVAVFGMADQLVLRPLPGTAARGAAYLSSDLRISPET